MHTGSQHVLLAESWAELTKPIIVDPILSINCGASSTMISGVLQTGSENKFAVVDFDDTPHF